MIEKDEMAHVFDGETHPAIKKLHEEGYGICAICGRKLVLEKLELMADGQYHSCKKCKEYKTRPRL